MPTFTPALTLEAEIARLRDLLTDYHYYLIWDEADGFILTYNEDDGTVSMAWIIERGTLTCDAANAVEAMLVEADMAAERAMEGRAFDDEGRSSYPSTPAEAFWTDRELVALHGISASAHDAPTPPDSYPLSDDEPLWVDYDLEGEGYTVVWGVSSPILSLECLEAYTKGYPYSEVDTRLVAFQGQYFSQEGFIEHITPTVIMPSKYDDIPF